MACTVDPSCVIGGGGGCPCCQKATQGCCPLDTATALEATVTSTPVPPLKPPQTVNFTMNWDSNNCVWRGTAIFDAAHCGTIVFCLSCCTTPWNDCSDFKIGIEKPPSICCGLCGTSACSITLPCFCDPILLLFACGAFGCSFQGSISE